MLLCTEMTGSLIVQGWRSLLHLRLSLTVRVVGAPQTISQPVSSIFFVLHCPLGLSELQACPFLDAVFPPLPLSALSSSPFHCALQDGLAGRDEQESCPYHFSLHLFTMVSRCSCGPIACWILAQTSCLVTWSLYEMHSSQGWHFPLKVNCSGGLWVYKIRLTNHQKATGVSWTERSTLFHKLVRGKSSEGGKRPEAHQIMIKVKLHEGFNHISPF